MENSTSHSLVVFDSEVDLDSMQTHKKLPYSDNIPDAQTPSTNDTPKTVTVNIGECRCHHCLHGNHGANQWRGSPFGVLKTIAVTSLVLVFLHHVIQSGGPCQCGGSKLIGMAADLSGSGGHSGPNERLKGGDRDGQKDEGLEGRMTNDAVSEVMSNNRGEDRMHGVREDVMSLKLREGIKNAEWNEGRRSVVEGDDEDDEDDELSEDVDLSQGMVDSGRDHARLKRETPERKITASDLSELLAHHPRRKRPRGKDKDKDKERSKDKSKGKNKGKDKGKNKAKDKGKNKGKDKDRENAKSRSRRSNRRRQLRRDINEIRAQIALLNNTHQVDLAEVRSVIRLMNTNQRVAIHLNYTRGHLSSLLHHDTSARSNQNGYYFIWSLHHTSPGYNYFNYTLAPNHSPFQDIYGVRIKMAGQYQVYSQLMVNGRDEENGAINPNDCGHQTVLVTSGGVTKLLESFVTQYRLGTPYFGNGENARRPRDTPLQMGVFYLNVGDEIRVKIPDNCHHFYYRPSSHSNAAYFGLIRL